MRFKRHDRFSRGHQFFFVLSKTNERIKSSISKSFRNESFNYNLSKSIFFVCKLFGSSQSYISHCFITILCQRRRLNKLCANHNFLSYFILDFSFQVISSHCCFFRSVLCNGIEAKLWGQLCLIRDKLKLPGVNFTNIL